MTLQQSSELAATVTAALLGVLIYVFETLLSGSEKLDLSSFIRFKMHLKIKFSTHYKCNALGPEALKIVINVDTKGLTGDDAI